MGKNKDKTGEKITTRDTSIKEKPEERAISVGKHGEIMLRIHVTPNAKTTRITGIGKDEIELAIAAPPRDGQANERLVKAIMDFLDLRKNEISFEMGTRSRSKVLRITSKRVTVEEVSERLERILVDH